MVVAEASGTIEGRRAPVTERVSCLLCTHPSVRALAVTLSELRSVALLDLVGRSSTWVTH